jgi:hypothetical protein
MKAHLPWLAAFAAAVLPPLVSAAAAPIAAPGPVIPIFARTLGRRQDSSSSVTSGGDSTPTSNPPPENDVTRTVTVTVDGNGETSTVTQPTTVVTTTVRTVLVTSTAYEFVTVTVSNVDVATETVFETVTETVTPAAAKRGIEARTTGVVDYPLYEPAPPAAGVAHVIQKRATIIVTRTVTNDGDAVTTTVFSTVSRVVTRSTTEVTTTTSEISSTTFLNAATTTTVTSTLTVQTTPVDTGAPTDTGSSEDPGSSDLPAEDENQESAGLSTGAKIGIGVGVGGGALIILAALAGMWFMRRRRNRLRPDDLAGAGGMSEVPVGPPLGASPASPEGYRGTAAAVPSAISGYKTSSNMGSSGMGGSTLGDDSLPAMPEHQRDSMMHPQAYEMPPGGYRNF